VAQLDVHLLGRPVVLVDGVAAPPPKGAKPWALLAYLAASGQAHPRAELAELLFGEAADPLGALRWSLAALRRLLSRPDALKGDTIRLDLADAVIDSQRLEAGDVAGFEPGASGLLLCGLSFPDSPRFEMWLSGERARLLRRGTSLLRESALRALAAGDHELAVSRAGDLVLIDPLDEGHHALLIRAHASAGDAAAARAQYDHCRDILRRELSIEPGPAVVAAAHLAAGVADAAKSADLRTIDAHMTVAWQSFLAGSVDYGIDLGRSAVAMADRDDDTGLQIMARLFFAAMLSIAVRGWDEAATAVTQALHLAEPEDRPFEEATARGILAGTDLMRADYPAAVLHTNIGAARSTDAGAQSINLSFLAAVEADIGQGTQAIRHAMEGVALAEESADPIRIVYATAYAGYTLLLTDNAQLARDHLERAVAVASSLLVLLPWPLAMLAEVEVRAGRLDAAVEAAARAEAISTTTGIAYQRALALRAAALVDAARGNHQAATERLVEALDHARRTTGEGYAFHWPVAWILDSLAQVSADHDPEASRRWAEALRDHATAIGMHTFVRRADRLLDPPTAGSSLGGRTGSVSG
jgi:DNA-binding SARP family transcriptional activator